MELVLGIHSITRWIVVILGVALLILMLVGLISKKEEFSKMDNGISRAFAGFVDLQFTIGLILIIWQSIAVGTLLRASMEHAITMLVVAVLAHLPARWNNEPAATRYKNTLITMVVIIVLIYVGVATVGGWAS
jgi:hypothetical protein